MPALVKPAVLLRMPEKVVAPVLETVRVRLVVPRLKLPEKVRSEAPPRVELAAMERALARVSGEPSPCTAPPASASVPTPNEALLVATRVPAETVVEPA